jgi:hypothetical protein
MSLIDAYRLHISGGTFNKIQRLQQNEYHVGGDLIQSRGENGQQSFTASVTPGLRTRCAGFSILERHIAGDAFYNSEQGRIALNIHYHQFSCPGRQI